MISFSIARSRLMIVGWPELSFLVQSTKSLMQRKDINVKHAELDHPSNVAMGVHLASTLNPCNDCDWERQKGGC